MLIPMAEPLPSSLSFGARVVVAFGILALLGFVAFRVLLEAAGPPPGSTVGAAVVPERAPAGRESLPAGPAPAEKEMWGSPWVRGAIVDREGRGLSHAQVRLDLEVRGRVLPLRRLSAGPDGRFELRLGEAARLGKLDHGAARVRVAAWSTGYALRETVVDLPAEREGGIELVLELFAGGSVAGRVVDFQGRPAAGAAVRLKAVAPSAPGSRVWPLEVIADEGGRFRFGFDGASFTDLEAHADGVGFAALRGLQLDPRGHTELADIVLEQGATLSGVARYPDGTPATFLPLVAASAAADDGRAEGAERARTRTDAQGWFSFVGLRPGPQHLAFDEPRLRGPALDEPVHTGRQDVEVVVDAHRLVLLVRDGDGLPFAGAWTSCHPLRRVAGSEAYAPLSTAFESFDVRRAEGPHAVASFTVRPEVAYGLLAQTEATVAAEEFAGPQPRAYERSFHLRLDAGARTGALRVALTDVAGASLAPFWVGLTSPRTGLPLASALVEPGTVGPLRFPEGEYVVTARSLRSEDAHDPGFLLPAASEAPVELRAGKESLVELVAYAGGRLRLRFDSSGAPDGPRVIRVWAQHAAGGEARLVDFFVYGADGAQSRGELRYGEENLSRTVLTPGGYTVEIEMPEAPELRIPVDVAPESVTEIGVPL